MNTYQSTTIGAIQSITPSASYFGGRVTAARLPAFESASGVLMPLDMHAFDLQVIRSFLVRAQPGAVRGGHAHRSGKQLLVCISGEIEVEVSHEGRDHRIVLGVDADALMISSPVWARQTYRGESPCLLVFCDFPYDPNSYIHEKKGCPSSSAPSSHGGPSDD